jgi:hypothetical protein
MTLPLVRVEQPLEAPFQLRVRLRARRYASRLRAAWTAEQSEPGQGLTIGHAEVDTALSDPNLRSAAFGDQAVAKDLDTAIRAADELAASAADWDLMRREFGLGEADLDFLMLLLAAESNPALWRVYGYLNDDVRACHATPALAAEMFEWPPGIGIDGASPLARWRMAWPIEGAGTGASAAPWVLDPHIASWLARGPCADPALGDTVEMISGRDIAGFECLYPEALAAMRDYAIALRPLSREAPRAIELELVGPAGAGKRILAAQLCERLGLDLLVADVPRLVGPDVPLNVAIERLIRVSRLGRLTRTPVLWRQADSIPFEPWRSTRFARAGSLTLLAVAAPRGDHDALTPRRTFRLPALGRAARVNLWEHLSDEPVPSQVGEWQFVPGEIASAAASAAAGPEAVAEVCRQLLYQAPGELFTPMPCPYTWNDMVLTPGVRDHVEEFLAHARLRGEVYEGWGFDRLVPLGRGVSAMFAGPSGTGKTMAAQVIARSLDMDLYRVDLAGVMNKYIGETEKRLKQIFDTCQRANVVVLFDEADALFGQRMQVKDAHDRFANVQIDYLLQRMDQFDGVAILASNRKSDIDPAFMRRLRFIVDFVEPGPAERLRLWQMALLAETPAGEPLLEPIDWNYLATKLPLTGADIKNAALGAAFRARHEQSRIRMDHVLAAVRRELAKRSVVLRMADPEAVGHA